MIASAVDYRAQSPAVSQRFERLKQRPVVLEVRDLIKTFPGAGGPTLALDRISFDTHRREFLCVIGPSGCGKSTLARLIAGLDAPSGGAMRLDGDAIDGPCPDRGMVFQGYTLFPWLTVRQNIMFGPRVSRGLAASLAETEANEWIDLVGLSRFADSYPHQLSGGMKQRVAIARALANRPRLLLMDEPFGALDAQTRAQMQSYLLQIWKQVDITIVFITHDLDEAVYLADRVLVLDAHPGRVRELIEVPVPRPRTREQFESAEFIATRKHLETLIHPPTAPGETERLPLIRMTVIGDDVE
ncbi:MAG TPA: ABC transporter ATP-binding protein [Polyangia bacterium]|jgi:NitT/TauT family transport system ATP-binding protein|nr:ABC transporter ATP-binding protein [Polyangia bacterium]